MEQTSEQTNSLGSVAVTQPTQTPNPLMKKIPNNNKKNNLFIILGVVVVIIFGIGTGWALARPDSSGSNQNSDTNIVMEGGEVKEAGEESETDDTAEGVLYEGGIEGDGTHRLERGDDPQHFVALTSTVVDLQAFADKNVQVWGQSIAPDNAPWLMDVSRIKVIEE